MTMAHGRGPRLLPPTPLPPTAVPTSGTSHLPLSPLPPCAAGSARPSGMGSQVTSSLAAMGQQCDGSAVPCALLATTLTSLWFLSATWACP